MRRRFHFDVGASGLRSRWFDTSARHRSATASLDALGNRSLVNSVGTRFDDSSFLLLVAFVGAAPVALLALRCLPLLWPLGCSAILGYGHRSSFGYSTSIASIELVRRASRIAVGRFHALRLRTPSGRRGLSCGGRPCPPCLRASHSNRDWGPRPSSRGNADSPLDTANRFRRAWRPGSLRQRRYAGGGAFIRPLLLQSAKQTRFYFSSRVGLTQVTAPTVAL